MIFCSGNLSTNFRSDFFIAVAVALAFRNWAAVLGLAFVFLMHVKHALVHVLVTIRHVLIAITIINIIS